MRRTRNDWVIKGVSETIRETLGREPTVGCEVGVWAGQLSRRLLKEFPRLCLCMVDPYLPYEDKLGKKPVDEMLDAMTEAVKETMFAAVRRMFWLTTSAAASMYFPDGYFDFAYVDANHSEEAVAEDFSLWYPKVCVGGWFGGHDYNGVGDRKGRFGVKKAVDRAAGLLGLEVHTTHQNVWYVKREIIRA